MLRGFLNAFRIPDLRTKILFVLAIVAVYRLGAHVPLPGVDYQVLTAFLEGFDAGGVTQLVNLFSGGALTQLSVFALGIMPYITASIIMQLLKVVIPKLDEWNKEGETGRRKITQWTRYLTIMLAMLQSTGLVVIIRGGGEQLFQQPIPNLMPNDTLPIMALMVLTLTAGVAFIMWLGELITEKGIGNGMSLIIFSAIVAELPNQLGAVLLGEGGELAFSIVMAVGLVLVVGVVFVELGQRRIPVQYAKRTVGNRTYGGSSTYIPLKVNQSGVIPIIFASSLLFLPQLLGGVLGPGAQQWIEANFQQDDPLFMVGFFALVVFFAFFYTAITFNPSDVADNMKRHGGFVPGIRPGRPTAEYLDYVLTRITTAGSLYLGFLAVLSFIVPALFGIPFPFAGAVILIAVGVMLNTLQQIESQLLQRNYEGFIS